MGQAMLELERTTVTGPLGLTGEALVIVHSITTGHSFFSQPGWRNWIFTNSLQVRQ